MRPAGTAELVVICQVMAHYRQGVHEALDALPDWDVTFASDPDGSHYSLATMPTTGLTRHVALTNVYLGRLSWQRGVLRLAFTGDFDVFVFTGDASVVTTWIGSAIARLRGKRVAFWTIGWHRPDTPLKSHVRLAFYRLADRLLLYGNRAKSLGTSAGYPAERMTVIYNSVTGTRLHRDRAQTLPADEPLRLGAIARLNGQKRFDLLVEAARILMDRGRRVEVVLAGSGPDQDGLEERAATLGVHLTLLGPVYDADAIRDFYSSLDVTVIPTFAGLTIIQSMAHGVPVVTDDDVDNQGPEWEAIRPETGGTYPQGDPVGLADVIETVAMDRRASGDMREACIHEIAERWTPERQAGRISAALHHDLASHRGTR